MYSSTSAESSGIASATMYRAPLQVLERQCPLIELPALVNKSALIVRVSSTLQNCRRLISRVWRFWSIL